jgi:hypothetical protein
MRSLLDRPKNEGNSPSLLNLSFLDRRDDDQRPLSQQRPPATELLEKVSLPDFLAASRFPNLDLFALRSADIT